MESRIAKKLFYNGKDLDRNNPNGGIPNPLIVMLDQDLAKSESIYKTLKTVYGMLNLPDSHTSPEYKNAMYMINHNPEYTEAINTFRKVCEQVREAQMGKGTPIKIESKGPNGEIVVKDVMATNINGYYVAIQSKIESGVYEQCWNPATLYNEQLFIFTPAQVREAEANVGTTGKTAVFKTDKSINETRIGTKGIGVFGVGPTAAPDVKSVQGAGAKVDQNGGDKKGGTTDVQTPNTPIAGGNIDDAP